MLSNNNIEFATNMAFWGKRTYEGVNFYIEPETELPEICPFDKPTNMPCPHEGLNKKTYRPYKQRLFIEGKPDLDKLFSKKTSQFSHKHPLSSCMQLLLPKAQNLL